jgi:HIP---CoA ligase
MMMDSGSSGAAPLTMKSDSVVTHPDPSADAGEVRFDLQFRNVPDVLRQRARKQPDKVAVIDDDVEYSYARMWELVRAAAGGFVRLGLTRGDRFAVMLENRVEWMVATLGALATGAVLVPISTRFHAPEVAVILQRSGARMFVTSTDGAQDYLAGVREALATAELDAIVVIGDDPGDGVIAWPDLLAEPLDAVSLDAMIDAIDPSDLSDIMFTSGTTGVPKGVMAAHGQSVRAHGQLTSTAGYVADDRVLVIPPFFHTWGYKSGWLGAMIQGGTSLPVRRHEAVTTMRTISEHGVTALPGPPTVFLDILDSPRRSEFDLTSLRLAFPAATTVPASLVLRIREELGVALVTTAYGLTETMATVTANSPTDTVEHITETVGRPIPGCEVRITGANGEVLGIDETGEIEVRGFNVTSGYWNDPLATAELFHDGWARSGDIGSVDPDGYVRITDRKKDMFIMGGFNAYPAEIELMLQTYPGVQKIAVIGVPDARSGEVGAAFVVPTPGAHVVPEELIAWSRSVLANFKVPRYVYVVDDLVYNPSGKVVKAALKEQHAALRAGEVVR